jgi:hypothetical protein
MRSGHNRRYRVKRIIAELKERIRAAEANESDHARGALSERRELEGYTRGLEDALFVVEGK